PGSHRNGPPPRDLFRDYRILGLQDIHLSYAAAFPPDHDIHRRLAALEPGDRLTLAESESGILVRDRQGTPVARLSKSASGAWAGKLKHILDARVLGMLHWRAEDGHDQYRAYARTSSWELPLVELVLKAPDPAGENEPP
ncbi:MAG: hypothetical protein P8X55_01675, partial [Desulfosarcinaceae bacterium]